MDEVYAIKDCSSCKQAKPLGQFNRQAAAKDGHKTVCRECQSIYRKEHYKQHAQEASEYARAYAAANPDKIKERSRKRYQALVNTPGFKESEHRRWRRWMDAHPDYYKDYHPRYHAQRKAQGIPRHDPQKARQYYEAHKHEIRARERIYQRSHREQVCARANRRRARKIAASVCESPDYRMIRERDGDRCHICGMVVAREDLNFDHVIPLARGGAHSAENIRVAHRECNQRKGTRLMSELWWLPNALEDAGVPVPVKRAPTS